jgi:hypothetical protein
MLVSLAYTSPFGINKMNTKFNLICIYGQMPLIKKRLKNKNLMTDWCEEVLPQCIHITSCHVTKTFQTDGSSVIKLSSMVSILVLQNCPIKTNVFIWYSVLIGCFFQVRVWVQNWAQSFSSTSMSAKLGSKLLSP